jgi:predicted transcriptional regulator
MVTVCVRLDQKTLEVLDRLAQVTGKSRSQVIRDAIDRLATEQLSGEEPWRVLADVAGCVDLGPLSEQTGRRFAELLRNRGSR